MVWEWLWLAWWLLWCFGSGCITWRNDLWLSTRTCTYLMLRRYPSWCLMTWFSNSSLAWKIRSFHVQALYRHAVTHCGIDLFTPIGSQWRLLWVLIWGYCPYRVLCVCTRVLILDMVCLGFRLCSTSSSIHSYVTRSSTKSVTRRMLGIYTCMYMYMYMAYYTMY